ncbi:g7348 [Coccomyxa viridis]|uniref:cysteine-S-conjugate beta-lyase n=1 Tax=Coccomyxa viridis TaxID=1274662 RepID=A0ABP1G017_9CHLO
MSHLHTVLTFRDAGSCCPFRPHSSRAAPRWSRTSREGRTTRSMDQTASTVASMGNGAEAPESPRQKSLATRLLHPPKVTQDPYGAVAPPLYQTATFDQVSAVQCGPYDYTRSGNPTRDQLEAQMADLEGAARSFAFASGMAALAVVLRLVKSGQHVVAGDDIYGGTSRLLAQVAPGLGIDVTNVDTTDIQAFEKSLQPGHTRLVMLESPTNPRMQICDIRRLVEISHKAGALVVVDNSILAPVFQQPLALGADISMTSGTKFIGGHSDITAGILSVKDAELAKQVYFFQNAEGAILGPFDCWLAMRGLKTMALRMRRQAASAAIIARWLARHPLVKKVNYPGLPAHPGHDIHVAQASAGGSLLSFETGSTEASRTIAEEAQLFKITVSFGSVSSLISLPCYMSHASIPADVRAARGLPDDLVRISVGIEDPEDLLEDLQQAFQKAMNRIGMEAKAPAIDAEVLAQTDREQELLDRIAELEAKLQMQEARH